MLTVCFGRPPVSVTTLGTYPFIPRTDTPSSQYTPSRSHDYASNQLLHACLQVHHLDELSQLHNDMGVSMLGGVWRGEWMDLESRDWFGCSVTTR